MQELSQGANAPMTTARATLAFAWPAAHGSTVDLSAYLLGPAGRVRGDPDMVFYNAPRSPEGAVSFRASADGGAFDVDTDAVPAEIERIVFCATATGMARTLAAFDGASVTAGPSGGAATLHFRPALAGAPEAAMIFAELYRRAGAWKLRAVGQGFNGGLAPLARSFGIDVADEPPTPGPTRTLAPAPAPVSPTPVSLAKITLDKPGQKVSLEKKGAGFGDIVVNLNWSRGRGGWGSQAVDLDLGCLYGLTNGERHAVQALGRQFGAFDRPPYIELSGDDRTGDAAAGETMRINGARWDQIERVLIFASIYQGVANWQATNGVVTVAVPGQPVLEVPMTGGRGDRRLCGVALIENRGGRIELTRVVEYFSGARALDKQFGWGLRWVAGSKD